MHSQAPARPEQTVPNSLTDIARNALRAAALAPTSNDALDVAGAALGTIARAASSQASDTSTLPRSRDIATAIQRACLLFSLIEGAAAGHDPADSTRMLARTGHELLASVGLELEQLLGTRPVLHGSANHA